MLGVERKHPDSHLAAWFAKKAIEVAEYQYWLKSPFSLFFSKNTFIFLSIDDLNIFKQLYSLMSPLF